MQFRKSLLRLFIATVIVTAASAELRMPAIFSDHMVLQQKQANPIWGWDQPKTEVTVIFAGLSKTAVAAADGRWTLKLDPQTADALPQSMTIKGSTEKKIEDILIGEVWMCSGQSNMEWLLSNATNGDLEALTSNLSGLRLIKVPSVGSQELQLDFKGTWQPSNADTSSGFSAVGLLYGRYLHQILGVPVGLIDNAWGGSAAEAWIRRSSLESDPRFKSMMEGYVKNETELQKPNVAINEALEAAKYATDVKQAKLESKSVPLAPKVASDWLTGNARPGNIFNGVLLPTLGYGIKGVIWYQGESNAERATEYAELFPYLIEQWRKEWGQGDFPFYWCQLANYKPQSDQPSESQWAELRDAQTKTLRLPNTGQAVLIDIGEGKDIHPKNKHEVAARLVRWALARDYGKTIPCRSPEFKNIEIADNKATVGFDCFGSSLRSFGVNEALGFAMRGDDGVWQWAKGTVIEPDKIELTAEKVPHPNAVRYAWGDNPACNLYSKDNLPVTPFQTELVQAK
jgi:sialate O-acetylesterase